MAVAIRKHGYTNVRIYNGGLKDWLKSGNTVTAIDRLPEYEVSFLTGEELMAQVTSAEKNDCRGSAGKPLFTLLDLRTELSLDPAGPRVAIRTSCPTVVGLLDDLLKQSFREHIPSDSPVYVITETGNRDAFAVKYLSVFGHRNIIGLLFGMRGWIKADYPITRINE